MDEGWEYLIAVAEKIIKKCADLQTQEKYFMIKEQLIKKGSIASQRSEGSQNSQLSRQSLRTLPSQAICTTPSKSVLAESIFSITANAESRQSVRSKTVVRDMSKARIRSKSHKIKTDYESKDDSKRVLTHVASILANA